jgi:hypothetical protein
LRVYGIGRDVIAFLKKNISLLSKGFFIYRLLSIEIPNTEGKK